MDRFTSRQPILSALLAMILFGAATGSAPAADPQKQILDGLRAGGHYEEAIRYLQHARADSNTPKAFAETIDYELAVIQIDSAASLAEAERDKQLQLAQESLAKFLADHPRHILAAAARSQLGNVLFDRGRSRRMLAAQFAGPTQQQHSQTARGLLHQADDFWAGIDKASDDELSRLALSPDQGKRDPPPSIVDNGKGRNSPAGTGTRQNSPLLPVPVGTSGSSEIKRSEARDQIHRRQVEARLARAWVQYELGQTYPDGSGERTAALQDAGKRFDAIYDQQRNRLAGFYARLGRGLCGKGLGESERAFAIFEELLGLPDDPADFHALRGKAAVQALETALRPEIKKYKPALDIAKRWLSASSETSMNSAQAAGDHLRPASDEVDLAVRFLGGEAALAYLKTLPDAPPEQSALRTRHIDWARQQFMVVAAVAGPYQARANSCLSDAAFGPASSPAQAAEPGSFADARNRAKMALDRFLAAQAEQKATEQSAIGGAGATIDRDSQRQRQQQIATAQGEALKYCRLAADLRTAAVSAADYDTVRYYLAYLHYAAGELDEAATLGEAVAQASSDSAAARQAARIGLAAREALLRRATDDARLTATERLQALAEKIIERWGQRAEADDARGVLLDLALGEGRLEKAEQYLQQMSDVSLRRGEAEMNLGRAVWQRAQHVSRSSNFEHDDSGEAEKTIARAADLLRDGIAKYRKSSPDSTDYGGGASENSALSKAMLALAQIHMISGRPAEALALLEDPGMAASGDSPSQEIEKKGLAILADVATGQLDKAKAGLQALQASLPQAGNTDAARRTLQNCVRIHRLVKQHLAEYRIRRLSDLSQKMVQNFSDFLASLAEGPAARSFFVSAWRAEAYAGMAEGLDFGGLGVLPPAEKQYRKAIATFQEILDRVAADSKFSPSAEATVAVRIELARCLRRLADHPHALFQLLIVLKEHPLMVDAQVEAAYTYQSWGDEKPECLDLAIQGGKQYKEVWGWGELAKRVQFETRFHDVYHEARYNLAICRLHQAQIATDQAQRARLASAAENDILATQRSAPDMGGAVWYDRYNELLKRIQRLAGDRPVVGLPKP